MKLIDTSKLLDGMLTDEAGTSLLDRGIGLCISPNDPRKRRSHNAIVRYLTPMLIQYYKLSTPAGWYVGNAEWPRSAWQPIKGNGSLEGELNDETFPRDVRFVWPHGAVLEQGVRAAARFKVGAPYDVSPYVRRILQLMGMFNPFLAWLATLIPNPSGWLYCTEECRTTCWLPEGIDPWQGNAWADPGDTVTAEDKGFLDVIAGIVKVIS